MVRGSWEIKGFMIYGDFWCLEGPGWVDLLEVDEGVGTEGTDLVLWQEVLDFLEGEGHWSPVFITHSSVQLATSWNHHLSLQGLSRPLEGFLTKFLFLRLVLQMVLQDDSSPAVDCGWRTCCPVNRSAATGFPSVVVKAEICGSSLTQGDSSFFWRLGCLFWCNMQIIPWRYEPWLRFKSSAGISSVFWDEIWFVCPEMTSSKILRIKPMF